MIRLKKLFIQKITIPLYRAHIPNNSNIFIKLRVNYEHLQLIDLIMKKSSLFEHSV